MEQDTIFGKIIRGEVPAVKVYEDEKFLAFLDINPVMKGHTLLIPKERYEWFQDVPNELIGDIFVKAKELVCAMKHALLCDYVHIAIEGKDVPHFHIHLIPALFDHRSVTWEHVPYQEAEMQVFAEKIKQAMQ